MQFCDAKSQNSQSDNCSHNVDSTVQRLVSKEKINKINQELQSDMSYKAQSQGKDHSAKLMADRQKMDEDCLIDELNPNSKKKSYFFGNQRNSSSNELMEDSGSRSQSQSKS